MYSLEALQLEAQEALDKMWFVQSVKIVKQTDFIISLRLYIRAGLFVQAFMGTLTGSLYFALIEEGQRVFGIDRENDAWHIHPYNAPNQHKPFPEGLFPKPLMRFLSRVEELLFEHYFL